MLSIFGEWERPNYLNVCVPLEVFPFILCAHNISSYRLVDCFHARETKRNLIHAGLHVDLYQEIESTYACMEHSAGTGASLFGVLCSQTPPPSNYVYIELSGRLDASPPRPLLYSRISKGEGYKCRVGVSRNVRACAYVRCAPVRRIYET